MGNDQPRMAGPGGPVVPPTSIQSGPTPIQPQTTAPSNTIAISAASTQPPMASIIKAGEQRPGAACTAVISGGTSVPRGE